ncbi:MAG: DUF960 family protein [Eubacteriales bacterium]
MTDNSRYITRSALLQVPLWLQNFMWYAIETIPVERDYLQVFKLYHLNGSQKIVHTQENPPYRNEFTVDAPEGVSTKVYILDNGAYSTMMLPSDY